MIPWAHPSPQPNGISIVSAVFVQTTAECIYTLQWDALPPSKLPLPMGKFIPHVIQGTLDPPSPQPKWHLHRFSRFCRAHQCDWQTDRQTDRLTNHPSWSVTIGHIYACSTAMLMYQLPTMLVQSVTQFPVILLTNLSFPSPNDVIRPLPLRPSALCCMAPTRVWSTTQRIWG